MTKVEILNFLSSHKELLQKDFGIEKIGLFGSYARNEAREDSDIDLAVEIKSKNKFRSFFALKEYLEKNLNKKVDLGIESTLKPIVKEYVSKDIIYV